MKRYSDYIIPILALLTSIAALIVNIVRVLR